MSDYSKTVNFATKDSLSSGDSNKIVRGTEINTEFDNIATAIATKLDSSGAVFTNPVSYPDGSASSPAITNTGDTNCGLFFSAADTLAFTAGGTAQFTMADGVIAPVTDNDVDLGTSSLEFKDAYFDGTVTTDGLTVSGTTNLDGAIQVDNTVTVGVDDTGYDVKFFGDTASAYMLWDASADDLILGGAAGLDVDGTTNLDVVDIDGAVQIDNTLSVGVDDTGYDVKFFGATSGTYLLWDESADSLINKGTTDSVNFKINGGQGSDGQVLTSTGSGVAWEAAGGAYNDWSVKTGTYTAVNKDQLIANHASTAFTITLPASPSAGNTVIIKNVGAALVTIGRNSSNIDSVAADGTLPKGNAVQLVYVDGTIGWASL
jgi:hypothetical protein